MNFRRIFLVKCLLLLFPSVKCYSTSLVYKAVNETALLSFTVPGSIFEVIWKKEGQRMIQVKNNKTRHFVNKDGCRCVLLRNGTLQIQRLVKEDGGNYTVMIYQPDGKLKAEENITLLVGDPVLQPILSAECRNETAFVKCEVKQKTKDEAFIIELTQPNGRKIQKNTTMLEWEGRKSGMFRCVAKNKFSEKKTEKVIKCSGKLDFYLILSIAGGALFFVISVICLIYCIRRKKTKRHEDYEEERAMQALPTERERRMRELPQAPSAATPKALRAQPRPLPQPREPQQAVPPRPRPRTQPRSANLPRERP